MSLASHSTNVIPGRRKAARPESSHLCRWLLVSGLPGGACSDGAKRRSECSGPGMTKSNGQRQKAAGAPSSRRN